MGSVQNVPNTHTEFTLAPRPHQTRPPLQMNQAHSDASRAGPYKCHLCTKMLQSGKEHGLGMYTCGMHVVSIAARFRFASRSATLAEELDKLHEARSSMLATLFAVSSEWDRTLLHHSMAYSTLTAYNYVFGLDQSGRLHRLPSCKVQTAATAMLRQQVSQDDITSPRYYKHHVRTSRATRPGLVVAAI